MADIQIHIQGAWAYMTGVSPRELEPCLSVLDPKRYYNKAFREKRWDGKVRFYDGGQFPAGLAFRVKGYFEQQGYSVEVFDPNRSEPVVVDWFGPDYLPGITLWPHQVEAVRGLLKLDRGVLKSATGSGKTEMMIAAARIFFEEKGWPSLIVVPNRDVLAQTVARCHRYYEGDLSVGQFGDGVKEIGDVTVGTAQTLSKCVARSRYDKAIRMERVIPADPEVVRLLEQVRVLFLDETHHGSSHTWLDVAMTCPAVRRYGLSGTPLKANDVMDLKMMGATGPVLLEVSGHDMVEQGLAAEPKIAMVCADNASGPDLPTRWSEENGKQTPLPYAEAYVQGVVENQYHNDAVLRSVAWLVDHGRQTLILCRRKDHFKHLEERLEESGLSFLAVWGDSETSERLAAKRALEEGTVNAVLATVIFDEGTDIPCVGGLVLAEGVKARTNVLQRIGRGMRRTKDKDDVWIVDIVPTCHPKLLEHGLERARVYEHEGYSVQAVLMWPEGDADPDGDLLPFLSWDAAEVEA